nr:response regulator [Bdellovibrionales bacterium]
MNNPIKILAVDDKPNNLVALQAVFQDSDYRLIEAESGYQALDLLVAHPDVAVVLLDVQMPGMDGFETASRIKQIPGMQTIPIIFITAVFHEDPFVKQGYKVGGLDYFSKPFDPDILKLKVGIYASLKQKAFLIEERVKRITETEELLKAGRKLTAILETLSVGVLISDGQGNICQINEVVSKILKTSEAFKKDNYGEVIGWWDHQGNILKQENSPLAMALSRGETSHNNQIKITCLDGTSKIVVASASPLKGLDDHIVGAVVV